MNITIGITGLESLAESINNLAAALRAGVKAEEVIKVASRKAKQSAPEPEPAKTYEIDEVRGLLAAKVKEGKQAEVRELLAKYGATSFSTVPQEHFAEIFAAAEKL